MKTFFSKHWFLFSVVLSTLVAAVLTFYQLGQVPQGMTWDEAAIGYNGYAILTTRRDEWLFRLPVSFRSFGDYKAPLAIYLNGIFTYAFGMNLFAVRFPFAFASVVGIAGAILLTQQLLVLMGFRDKKKVAYLALLSGFLLIFSPWYFHFSRIGFETDIMLAFVLWGFFCLCGLLNEVKLWPKFENKKPWQGYVSPFFFTLGTTLCLTAAIYTYHSAKVVLPFLIVGFSLLFVKKLWLQKGWLFFGGIMGGALLIPFIKDTLWSTGGERFTQATVFGLPISFQEKLSLTVEHFVRHFNIDYLLFGATTTLRHGDGVWGVLLPTTFCLVLCGLVFGIMALFGKKTESTAKDAKFFLFAVFWIVVGALPAAIGRDVPHSNRDFLALPGFVLLATFGWSKLIEFLGQTKLNEQVSGSKGEKNLLVKSVVGTWLLLHLLFFSQYLYHYFTVFSHQSANDFQDGYLEAAQFAVTNEENSDKILFTSAYGQPYIYALFVRQTNPIWYQGGSLIKYEFSSNINIGDFDRHNTTIVATPKEIDPKLADQLVYGSDGQIRFVLIRPKK
jgi:4-amino-4-deoxy-L-arabinose transferase-like glycosyltransferase